MPLWRIHFQFPSIACLFSLRIALWVVIGFLLNHKACNGDNVYVGHRVACDVAPLSITGTMARWDQWTFRSVTYDMRMLLP